MYFSSILLLWVDHVQQVSTHTAASSLPPASFPSETEERIGEKGRKPVGQLKDGLISKGKEK